MVGLGEGEPGGNYDMYGRGINSSVPDGGGYGDQYYYGGNDGYAINSGAGENEHVNFGTGTGLRKRNVQGGGSGGANDGDDDNKVTIDVGHNSSGDENQTLLAKKKAPSDRPPACYHLRRCLGCIISRERRQLTLKGRRRPGSYPTNRQNNRKYNACTLIPLVLYNQFKFFYNFFFLVIALTQFIPVLKVGK